MSDTLYDPFSAAAAGGAPNGLPSTRPGLFGVSPSQWESVAQLGAGMIQGANQRTGSGHLANGTGPAGGIMGAVQGYYGDVQNQAKLRSQLAQEGAQTQGLNLSNQAAASGLGLTKARNALSQKIMSDPNFMQQLQGMMSGGGGQDFGAAPPPGGVLGGGGVAGGPLAGGGGDIAPLVQKIHQNESGGSMAPGIMGDGGKAFGPMQVHQGALDDVNRANGTSYTLPQLAAQPEIGKWVGQQYLQQQVSRFGPRAGAAAYNAGPGSVQNAIRSGQPLPAQDYLSKAGLGQSGQLGPVDPQSALAMSQRMMAQANQLEVYKSLGLPIPGDPAVLRQQAQKYLDLATAGPKAGAAKAAEAGVELATGGQIAGAKKQAEADVDLRTSGAIQREKEMNSNVQFRSGDMQRIVAGQNPDGSPKYDWIKNPQLEKTFGPDGQPIYSHVSPALPNAPPGTPGTSEPVMGPGNQPVSAGVAPQIQHARNKAYEDFQGKDTDSYLAAQNTHGWLEQMSHAADTLNAGGGFLQTGPSAPERLSFANTVNDALRVAGLPQFFDANQIASWEELKKATTTAGFELSSHYEGHARQAASTIENATSAVPAATNSPVGFHTVLAGIREAAQSAVDMHEYKQQVYNSNGDLTRSEVDFYKQNSPQQYARRAISTVNPYQIQDEKDFARFLPGTYVTLPNGKLTQVPMRDGAPPIPSYLSGPAPQTDH